VKSFLAIVGQTIRSATRSKVFHVLFVLILLAVFLLPTTVSGDGTAAGLVQISITYSLNVVVALISATTLWLSCSLLSREIENYTLHMVIVKPCPRWKVWLGKWFGVLVMHTAILLVGAAIIYGLVIWRVSHGTFTAAELTRLRNETLVGRRSFRPKLPNFRADAEKEYEARLSEFPEGHDKTSTIEGIIRNNQAKFGEVKPGELKVFTFENIRLASANNDIFLRYRAFSGKTNDTNQKFIPCAWIFQEPVETEGVQPRQVPLQFSLPGGTFQEISLSEKLTPYLGDEAQGKTPDEIIRLPYKPSKMIQKDKNNSITIAFANMPQEAWGNVEAAPAVFQMADGPVLMTKVTGFGANYMRTILLAIFQLAFLAALGCTVGAAFSTPVAAFAAIAYLVIGMSVQMAVSAPLQNDDGSYSYKNPVEMVNHKFAQVVSVLVVSVDDLDSTSDLAKGILVEYNRIGATFLTMLVIRSGLLGLIGIWIMNKREFGLVTRK